MARSIAGLFPDRTSAEQAIVDLKNAGFDPSKIGIVMRDRNEARDVAAAQGTHSTEGAVAGGIIGGSLGAILVAVGALAIPGIGPIISGGVLATLVGGAAGWLVGGLAGLGIPEDEARYYEEQVGQGKALVTVDAQGRDDEARQILLSDGAENLQADASATTTGTQYGTTGATTAFGTAATVTSDVADQYATGTTAGQYTTGSTAGQYTTGTTGGQYAADATATTEDEVRIPIREEELIAGKRREEMGRVHIHKEVIEQPETVTVDTQRERVIVERVPFSGDVTTTDDAFVARDVDVPVMGEEIVVGKRIAGVEEVHVHKEAAVQEQQVSDTVRKERVIVDGVDAQGNATSRPGGSSRGSATGSTVNNKFPADINGETDASPDAGYATERDQIQSRGTSTDR